MRVRTLLVSLLLVTVASWLVPPPVAAAAQAPDKAKIQALLDKPVLTKPEQEELSAALFKQMMAADEGDLAFFEKTYKTVMDKCPDTDRAHQAYWRLTNLYTQAYDPPKTRDVVAILEQFLSRYTESSVVSFDKHPDRALVFSPLRSLHQAYEALGMFDKIVAYYDRAAARESSFAIYDYFDYASALEKTGRTMEAIVWYEKFLMKTRGNDDVDFMREIATDKVAELGKKK